MRFFTISILLGSLLLLSTGCQNASIRCQRETALLRAEILDLEDKYYALKSQHQNMLSGGSGTVVTNNVIGSGVITGAPVVADSWPVQGEIIHGGVIQGDVIYDDQVISGAPMIQAPIEGEVYYEGQVLPGVTPAAIPGVPTPAADPELLELEDIGSPPVDAGTDTGDGHSILLPDTEALELEVGFEDLELKLDGNEDVDRIEIVSSATRGKDLDGIAGHDGLEIMIQAINSNGDPIEKTGELTVTVRDNLAGEIGKWTFLPDELRLFLSRDELGHLGTLLHLPWTDKIPVSKQVEVRVSMLIGNIEYVATRQLKIKPPTGQPSNDAVVGWTINDDRWISVSQSPIQRQSAHSTNTWPTKPSSTAVQRPQWKPVR